MLKKNPSFILSEMRKFRNIGLLLLCLLAGSAHAQLFTETFDGASANDWVLENSAGSKNNPTPAGITGLTYNPTNQQTNSGCNNYWIINNRHSSDPGTRNSTGAKCGGGAANRSLHITFRDGATCPDATSRSAMPNSVEPAEGGDAYYPAGTAPITPGANAASDQMTVCNRTFSTMGQCNIVLEFDALIYGNNDPNGITDIVEHSILATIDNGATWVTVHPKLSKEWAAVAGCRQWRRIKIGLPRELYNQPSVKLAFRFRNQAISTNSLYQSLFTADGAFNIDNLQIVSSATNPTLTSSVDVASPCKGQKVSFQNTTVTDVRGIDYRWNITPATGFTVLDGFANQAVRDTIGNLSLQFTANGNYTVTLQGTTACGAPIAATAINITVANCPPQANFVAYQLEACATTPTPTSGSVTTVKLFDLTSSFPAITGYTWNIPGATFVSPSNANSQNPEVTFATAGTKTVTLTVTNAEGSDVETKTAYLDIKDCQCQLVGGGSTPVTVLEEDFETRTTKAALQGDGWVFDAGQAWTTGTLGNGINQWTVNNDYSAWEIGLNLFGCSPAGNSLGATPQQTGGSLGTVTNGPTSNYLHVYPTYTPGGLACLIGTGLNASWISNGVPVGARTVVKTKPINCTGVTGVEVCFITTSGSATATASQYTFKSSPGGATLAGPFNVTPNASAWQKICVTNAALDNQTFTIDFSFDPSSTDPVPSMSVDELIVTGTQGGGSSTPTTFVCPLPSPLCAGQAITIPFNAAGTWNAGNNFSAQLSNASGSFAAPVAIGSLPNTSGTNLTGLTINATIPGGTLAGTGYRIRIVGSAPNGGTQTNNDNGANITIGGLPVANAITGATSVCAGGSSTVYNVTNVAGSSFAWSVISGVQGTDWDIVSGQGTNQLRVQWLKNGTYTLRMTETNNCGNRQNNLTVNVTGKPVISALTGPIAVCQSATPVNYSVVNNPGTTSWSWAVTNGTISAGGSTNAPTVIWNTATGPATLTLTETNSCGTSTQMFNITVNNGAPATPTITGLNSVCTGSEVSYIAPGGLNYTWSVTGGTITNGQGTAIVSINWGAGPTGQVSLQVSSGCGTANATPLAVAVTAAPTVTAYNIGQQSFCLPNGSTTIEAQFSNGGTGVSITGWEVDMGSGFTAVAGSAGQNPLAVSNINESRTYRVQFATAGCGSLSTTQEADLTFGTLGSITCSLPSSVNAAADITNATITLPAGGTAPFTVEFWAIESASPAPVNFNTNNLNITLPAFNYPATGSDATYNYKAKVTDANGCEFGECTGSILVSDKRILTPAWSSPSYCQNDSAHISFSFTGSFTSGNQFGLILRDNIDNSVEYTRNNVTSPVILNFVADNIAPGNYEVEITATDNGILPVQGDDVLIIHPSPETGFTMQDTEGNVGTVFRLKDGFVTFDGPVYTGGTDISAVNVSCVWTVRHPVLGDIVCSSCDFVANCGGMLPPYAQPGVYNATLEITGAYSINCTETETLTFEIKPEASGISMPNVFTPNNDNLNDVFFVDVTKYKDLDIKVFSRNGQMVYSSGISNYKPWDGRMNGQDCAEGAYVVAMKATDLEGNVVEKTFTITLLR